MWYLGIDLHRLTVVMAGVNDAGEVMHCGQGQTLTAN